MDTPCPSSCSGNGVCANGTCACLIGWQGSDCSRLSCPDDCSQHGICQADATCLCDPGWGGAGCQTPLCPNGCSGKGACTNNGTCICYIGFEGDDCSILADCNKRGTRECGFCACEAGYFGDLCQYDKCQDSRKYKDGDMFQPIEVCSGHGRCSEHGCVCNLGYSGRNCSLPADCTGGTGAQQCSGHGSCSGGPGICEGKDGCPDQCTCDLTHQLVYTGDQCAQAICPGPFLNGEINECSGKGHCGASLETGVPTCTCVTAAGAGSYRDFDCMTPPKYFVQSVTPFVGPTEGGTHITLSGPGLDRIISRNHYIADWMDAKKHPSLMCQFDMSSDEDAWTLPLTPVVWKATVVKDFMPTSAQATEYHLELHIGDRLTVYGCNPCDTSGTDPNARLIAETTDGVLGFAPANLYYYDSENEWDKLTCDSPPSNATGLATMSITGRTAIVEGKLIEGSSIDVANMQPFEYYNYEIIDRLKPTKSPLRPVGGMRGPSDINRATTITVTGSYFPRMGDFSCQFFDPVTLDRQCKAKGAWVNEATITCQVPQMRRARKLTLYVSSNSQQFETGGIALTTYSVLKIEPVCIPTLGMARVRVSGDNLLPEAGQDPQITAYCRFGRVSTTLGSTSDDKLENWWAYHTVATPSTIVLGSLECAAPPAGIYLQTADFALSLDACECGREGCPTCLVKWAVPLGGQNYHYGQWDSTMGDWHDATGLPDVEMRTVVVPQVESIFPTSGFMPGGTPVTLHGKNFSSTRCGWGVNQAPACRFGNVITPRVTFINPATVVCISPPLETGVESEVMVSIAIDGQSYVKGPNFMYLKAYGVLQVQPNAASVQGGSRIIVSGPDKEYFAANPQFGPYRNTDAMSCVFIFSSGGQETTPASFMRPAQATCATPPSRFAQLAQVFLSPNARWEPSQRSLTSAKFMFFNAPVLSQVIDPMGSIQGGNVVLIVGTFVVDQDVRKTLPAACKFGDIVVPATFVDVSRLQCTVPPVDAPASVPVRVSLNGQDFSQTAVTYHYFDIEEVLPKVLPVRGGSRMMVRTRFEGNFTLANAICQLPYPEKSTGPDYVNQTECLQRNGNWLQLKFRLGFGVSGVSVQGSAGPFKNQLFFDIPSPIIDPDGNSIDLPSRHEVLLTIGDKMLQPYRFPEYVVTLYDLKVPCGPANQRPRICNAYPLPLIKLPGRSTTNVTVVLGNQRLMYGANVTCKMVSHLHSYSGHWHASEALR